MAERSLRVIDTNKTFFGKLSNTLSKLLIPTKIGINGIVITLKRNNLLKSYEAVNNAKNLDDAKKNALSDKYEESYSLYLEAIDKHIMDTVYKKVKNDTASEFEKKAMAEYYLITNLKNTDYAQYKYKKQKYLINLDYDSLKVSDKTKVINKYNGFYVSKMDTFYKGILKNYSVVLADSTKKTSSDIEKNFYNIFSTIDEYMKEIIPLKLNQDESDLLNKIKEIFDKYESLSNKELSCKQELEKKILLLNMSRIIFTHSLPLTAAEKCYEKIIDDCRNLVKNTEDKKQKEDIYLLLLDILKEYNEKLLSTKIYWEDLKQREKFKIFWEKFENSKTEKDKEILLLKRELLLVDEDVFGIDLIKFYKNKLVKFGVMREIKDSCRTYGKLIKVK